MKRAGKNVRISRPPVGPEAVLSGQHVRVEIDILRALATATTAYHEAPPERFEEARTAYLEALQRFRQAQCPEMVHTSTAGAGKKLNARE